MSHLFFVEGKDQKHNNLKIWFIHFLFFLLPLDWNLLSKRKREREREKGGEKGGEKEDHILGESSNSKKG